MELDISKEDYEELKVLEESLWREESRFDVVYMDKILTSDFEEYGRSGRVYTRQIVITPNKEQINIHWPLKNFKISLLSENVALVQYVSEVMYEEIEIGNRSSVWVKTDNGWKLRFHQGTAVNQSI